MLEPCETRQRSHQSQTGLKERKRPEQNRTANNIPYRKSLSSHQNQKNNIPQRTFQPCDPLPLPAWKEKWIPNFAREKWVGGTPNPLVRLSWRRGGVGRELCVCDEVRPCSPGHCPAAARSTGYPPRRTRQRNIRKDSWYLSKCSTAHSSLDSVRDSRGENCWSWCLQSECSGVALRALPGESASSSSSWHSSYGAVHRRVPWHTGLFGPAEQDTAEGGRWRGMEGTGSQIHDHQEPLSCPCRRRPGLVPSGAEL